MTLPRPKSRSGKTRSGARVQRPQPALPLWQQPLQRRPWLRALAYLIGALVMLAHIYTFETPAAIRSMFEVNVRDAIYHGGMFALFTIAYRFSLIPGSAGLRAGRSSAGAQSHPTFIDAAAATALWVCCGWGALCEGLQWFVPGREFHLFELALNTGVPVIVIALISLAGRRG